MKKDQKYLKTNFKKKKKKKKKKRSGLVGGGPFRVKRKKRKTKKREDRFLGEIGCMVVLSGKFGIFISSKYIRLSLI